MNQYYYILLYILYYIYISENCLVYHPDRQVLLRHQAQLLETLDLVSFILNRKKSVLDLVQDIQFLGILLCLDLGEALLPESIARVVAACACNLSFLRVLSYHRVSQFMGSLNWASGLIPLGRLYLRPLQSYFHSLGLTDRFTPPHRSDPLVLASLLQQWQDLPFITSGIPIRPFQAEYTIFMDASTQGWGAHMGDSQISGTWTPLDRELHISCLELKAVVSALHHWAPVLQGHQVSIAMDSSTVVSYINKQGGTRSHTLLRLVVELFTWLQAHNIVVGARYIPGCLNVIADHLSSPNQPITTEWSLHPKSRVRLSEFGGLHYWTCLPLFQTPQSSSVHVSNSGATSTGSGCSVSRLAGKVNVHVSTISLAQQSYSETTVHAGGRSNFNSPLVAETVMASTPTSSLSSLCGISAVLSIPTRYSVSTVSEIRLRWKVVPSACMVALMRHYKAAGFSDEVSSLPQHLGDPKPITCTTIGGFASPDGPQGRDLIHFVPQLLK